MLNIATREDVVRIPRGTLLYDKDSNPMVRTLEGDFAMWAADERRWIRFDAGEIIGTYHDDESYFLPLVAPELDELPGARDSQNDVEYEKCRDCHLFVEPNPSYGPPSPGIAEFVHLSRGNDADERLEDHEAVPSGMKANLATWQVFGPVAMRERFVTPARYAG